MDNQEQEYQCIVLYKNGKKIVHRMSLTDDEVYTCRKNICSVYERGLHGYLRCNNIMINVHETLEIEFREVCSKKH
jgi:hypothetical protein